MDSERLPGKALLDLGGRPLLGRVIERAKLIDAHLEIVVATSKRKIDDQIANFAKAQKVAVFRGDFEDVRTRAIMCCDHYGFSRFGRICGDSPLLLKDVWRRAIDLSNSSDYDLITNTFPRSFPIGMSVEVFSVNALAKSVELDASGSAKEHLGSSFYANADKFNIKNISCNEGDYSATSVAVDTREDLDRIALLIALYGDRLSTMSLEEIAQAVWECSKTTSSKTRQQ